MGQGIHILSFINEKNSLLFSNHFTKCCSVGLLLLVVVVVVEEEDMFHTFGIL
uniref:Uncharacterized protein n=1 Tax=Octopus bimaculoides TaxID=37653 RepID=A0A0L8FY53_OCTBM